MSKCQNPTCGKTIRQPATGRKRKYCSDRCKEAARPKRQRAERSSPHKVPAKREPTYRQRMNDEEARPETLPIDVNASEGAPVPATQAPGSYTHAVILSDGSEATCHLCHGPGGKGALPVCDECHEALNA